MKNPMPKTLAKASAKLCIASANHAQQKSWRIKCLQTARRKVPARKAHRSSWEQHREDIPSRIVYGKVFVVKRTEKHTEKKPMKKTVKNSVSINLSNLTQGQAAEKLYQKIAKMSHLQKLLRKIPFKIAHGRTKFLRTAQEILSIKTAVLWSLAK